MRASAILPAGSWDESQAADRVMLDYESRYRRRVMLRTESGVELILDLPEAARLRDGDGLVREDGGTVRVSAKPELLLEIQAPSVRDLLRVTWHLGNRHLPVQILADRVRVRDDHVIAGMVQGLGGHVNRIVAGFDPEAGAYAIAHHKHED
ncbi:MAG: urease accessory protein UreE [Acetobacteraceae bacterium]|nr:urease accessory protein UreE [Acetobacteraceae bacterium]